MVTNPQMFWQRADPESGVAEPALSIYVYSDGLIQITQDKGSILLNPESFEAFVRTARAVIKKQKESE